MKKVLKEMDLSSSNWPPRSVLSAISNAKNELLDAEAFAANAGDFGGYTLPIIGLAVLGATIGILAGPVED